MKHYNTVRTFLASLALLLPIIATANDKADELRNEIAQIKTEIDALVATGSCTAKTQCDAVALGSKACGGPQLYLPHAKNVNITKLNGLATQHRTKAHTLNKLLGALSDCAMVLKPSVQCVDNKCVIESQ